MSKLHLIQTQLDLNSFSKQYARLATEKDSLLFLNDGILSLLSSEFNSSQFKRMTINCSILVLDDQVEARAIDNDIDNLLVKKISYQEFVDYSLKSSKVITW